jgi:hypothetical protein
MSRGRDTRRLDCGAEAGNKKASYAGLTRVSITLHKSLSKKMDGRVKPGHDVLGGIRFLTSPRSFAGRGRREAPGEGPGTELPDQKLLGSEGLQRNQPVRESVDCICRSASPLTRSLRGVYHRAALRADPLAPASTSPRKSGARLRKRRCAASGARSNPSQKRHERCRHSTAMCEILTISVNRSKSAFISFASSSSCIGCPGISAWDRRSITSGDCSALLIAS